MVKLVYHTLTLGPIGLDYDRPVIRVGSDPANDLVLPHPSVRPRHCQIELQEDRARSLPPDNVLTSDTATTGTEDREYFVGDQLTVGELLFEIQHSTKTVAIPRLASDEEPEFLGNGPLYYCEHCRRSYPASALTRIGLVARPKHLLCPKCSHELVPPSSGAAPAGFFARLKRGLVTIGRWLQPRR